MVNERVFQGIAEGSSAVGTWGHGFTYSGHPVPAAVAIETLKIYDEMDIGAHVRRVGPHLQRQLRERFADHPLVGEVRGVGPAKLEKYGERFLAVVRGAASDGDAA